MVYIINHEDIYLESPETLTWTQFVDNTLNYDNLYINTGDYTDYQPTKLQFHLSSSMIRQTIKVKIPYANRLTRTQQKNAVVCQFDEARRQWVMITHTDNKESQSFDFQVETIGIYGIFVNEYWYSSFTQRLADEYPNWTKIRNEKGSTGQLFLNFFGVELETVQDYLEWIREQRYIGTADVKALDWVYRYQLPTVTQADTILITRFDGSVVPILESLKEFFYNDSNQGGIIDYDEKKFYTTKRLGPLNIAVNTAGYTIQPMDYHIWNSFDEFGLLLGVERLHLEENEEFKERILDVFRYPSGTHDIGLTNGIARDLRLISRKDRNDVDIVWSNDNLDLYLTNTTGKIIDTRTIQVDDILLTPDEFRIDEVGNLRIFARKTGEPHKVSFIYGIQKYELHNRQDETLHKMMFKEDGQATGTLRNWVEYINTVAPVMWDRFKWDEGFWDTIDKKLTGLGYVPNMWDSSIDAWKDYVFESDR